MGRICWYNKRRQGREATFKGSDEEAAVVNEEGRKENEKEEVKKRWKVREEKEKEQNENVHKRIKKEN